MKPFDVRTITVQEMTAFVAQHHYSTVMPRITKICYGGFREGVLVAAISFGWGSRPRHTIQRIFPSLNTRDYREIGKMCLADSEPKNSETQFMSVVFRMLHKHLPNLKLIFTWADGIWGKPGYVYQAASFLYGGFIWTEVYQTRDGQRIHPSQLQSEMRSYLRTQRPNAVELAERGWRHYFGKQFRYVKFLCDRKEQERLLAESPYYWDTRYPKADALEWRENINGCQVLCPQPEFTGTYRALRQAGASAPLTNPSAKRVTLPHMEKSKGGEQHTHRTAASVAGASEYAQALQHWYEPN